MTDQASTTIPPHGWTCFHCGETFLSPVCARAHFGSDETRAPACEIKTAGEGAILTALRNAEDALVRYHQEDSDVLRAMAAMEGDHRRALQDAEEQGYARGLRDARLPQAEQPS